MKKHLEEFLSLRVPKGTLSRLRNIAEAQDRYTGNVARICLLAGLELLEAEEIPNAPKKKKREE